MCISGGGRSQKRGHKGLRRVFTNPEVKDPAASSSDEDGEGKPTDKDTDKVCGFTFIILHFGSLGRKCSGAKNIFI